MARIRSIKPSFWSDERVVSLSLEARLLAICLVSMADDDGRFVATTQAIGGYGFPLDDLPAAKLRRWLSEVEDSGLIETYMYGNRCYAWFPRYRKHQRINRPQKSALPDPPAVTLFGEGA